MDNMINLPKTASNIPINSPAAAKLSSILTTSNLDISLKKALRQKITILLITTSVLPLILVTAFNLIYQAQVVAFTAFILIVAAIISGCGVYLVRKYLKPLDDILYGTSMLVKGEFDHKIKVRTGDELEFVADEINILAANLYSLLQRVKMDKDVLNIEKSKLEIIFTSLHDGLIAVDMNRRVIYANKSAEKVTGWSFSEMQNMALEQLIHISDTIGQEIPPIDYCPTTPAQLTGSKNFNEQPLTVLGKAGQRSFVTLTSYPIDASLNTDLGAILVLRNVSKQKELESMQLDFVSMASHELRTPITSIKGYLSVFINENKPKLTAENLEFLERIMVSANQLANLVDNLLNVSKVERGAFSVNIQPLDWARVLTQAVADNMMHAQQKNISLALQLPATPLPSVFADMVRINEVLSNLIGNAISYTPEGGKIIIATIAQGPEVITAISDTGKGLPREALPHLFTKFFRIQGALDKSSNSKGTGLGLYLSKSIIDLHKGRIWADSQGFNMGSTFYFSLPMNNKSSIKSELAPLNLSSTI